MRVEDCKFARRVLVDGVAVIEFAPTPIGPWSRWMDSGSVTVNGYVHIEHLTAPQPARLAGDATGGTR